MGDLNEAYKKLVIRNSGIQLLPLKSSYSGIMVCKVCGERFGSEDVFDYVHHVEKEHPEYVSSRMRKV